MRHLHKDYDAIQPWPVKRPHTCKNAAGETITLSGGDHPDADALVVTHGTHEPIIPDDEPVYILRATDRHAPYLLRHIATFDTPNTQEGLIEREKLRAWADEMERYAEEHGDTK